MEGVGAGVAPVQVEPDLVARRPRARQLVDLRADLERDVGGELLDGRHPHGDRAARLGRQVLAGGVEQGRDLAADVVGERLGRPQLRLQPSVPLEDVPLLGRAGLVVAAVGPGSRGGAGVGRAGLEATAGDAEVEVAEDELDRGQVEGAVDELDLLLVDVAGRGRPRHAHVGDGDAAGLGEPLAEVVPVVVEDDAGLLARDDREDVLVAALQHALEDGEVADLRAGGERLATGEDDLVALVADGEVVVAGVDRAAEEQVAGRVQLLHGGDLLGRADQAHGPGPQVVVGQELADRAVAGRDLAHDLVGQVPRLAGAAVLDGTEQGDEAGVLQELHFGGGHGLGAVALDGVGGQDAGDVGGTLEPAGGGGRSGLVGPGGRLHGVPDGQVVGDGHRVAPFLALVGNAARRGLATPAGTRPTPERARSGVWCQAVVRASSPSWPASTACVSSSRTIGSTFSPKYAMSSR